MKSWRRPLVLVALAALATSTVAACSSSGNGGQTVLRIGTTGTVESLNPFVSDDTLSFDFYQAIYPHLVQYDLKTKKPVADFATKWTSSAAGRKLTFTLVKNATWSDGKPLGAADVAWTIDLMLKFRKGPTAAWAGAVTHMTAAKAVNPTTVEIDYDHPVANAIALIARIPVLPQQSWAQYATGDGKQLTKVSNAPTSSAPLVSGGPFIFFKYLKGQAAVFKTNPKYWGSKPHIDGFGVQFFGNDDAEVSALKSNQIDLAMGNPSLPPTDVAPMRKSNLRIHTEPSVSFDDLIINTNSKKTSHTELLDPAVRKAFEYATDRQQIDQRVLLGFATPGASIIPPATGSWHDSAVKPLPYSVAKANQLLDTAGYKKGSDGIRQADGHDMAYDLLVSPDVAGGLRMGQILTQSFAKIGVTIHVRQIDDDALEDAITKNHYRDFDLALWGWDTEYDPSYMLEAMTCAQYGDDNDSGYCNADYDKLFAKQGVATDPAQRKAIVYEMQQKVADDRPYVVLHYLDVLEGWSRSWTQVTEGPTGFLSQFSASPLINIAKSV
jgi:peptide/nickel transport system substrate-binding protein